jgi:hypothetical protein
MKEIQLTQGQVALVDDEDFEWVNQHKWCALWNKSTESFYAVRTKGCGTVNGKRQRRAMYMHRVILGLEYGDPRKGDHKEPSETLNNQRYNLRIAKSGTESNANQNVRSDSSTGYKGVRKHGSGYGAQITTNGKYKNLGTRDTPEEASALYWAAAQEQFGEFARAV